MVIKIQKSAASCRGPVGYNERKVASGEARVIGVSNMDGDSLATVLRTFDRYEHNPAISAKASSLAFHMTINPGASEMMDDRTAMGLARDIMDGLGYSGQPFIVYRHDDTGREHYHVVSVRADKEGHIISNSHERRKLQSLMKELGPKYGFVTGKKELRGEIRIETATIKRFDPGMEEHLGQIRDIFLASSRYCFTSRKQLEQMLSHYGVRLIYRNTPTGEQMMLQGLDRQGKPYGPVLKDRDLGIKILDTVEESLARGQKEHRMKHREKDRVKGTACSCLRYASSSLHFERMMEKKGITPIFSRDRSGQIMGVTFIDHLGKCIFKCSELGEGISAGMFREAENDGRWVMVASGNDKEHTAEGMKESIAEEQSSAILDNLDSNAKSTEKDIRKKRKRPKGIKM